MIFFIAALVIGIGYGIWARSFREGFAATIGGLLCAALLCIGIGTILASNQTPVEINRYEIEAVGDNYVFYESPNFSFIAITEHGAPRTVYDSDLIVVYEDIAVPYVIESVKPLPFWGKAIAVDIRPLVYEIHIPEGSIEIITDMPIVGEK